jgi:hypothetical protein
LTCALSIFLITVARALLYYLFLSGLVRAHLPDALVSPELAQVMGRLREIFVLTTLSVPLFESVKIAGVLVLLFCCSYAVMGAVPPLRSLLAVICHSRMVVAVKVIFNLLVFLSRGISAEATPEKLLLTGLNVFFQLHDTGPMLYTLLAELSIFSLWYVVVFAIGLHRLIGFSRSSAAAAALLLWLMSVTLKMAVAAYLGYVYLGV